MKETKSIEDYLETIYILSEKGKAVRVKDIAEFLSIKPPSVTGTLKKLISSGYVEHSPYGKVVLTEKGRALGKAVWERHKIIFELLHRVIGVPYETAFKEACLIEHCISEDTKKKIKEFLKRND